MQRPTSVLVLGILNIMFGVLGVFGLFGSAAILLGMNPSNPMNRILESSDFYRYYLWTSFFLGFFATIVLLAAGAGRFSPTGSGGTTAMPGRLGRENRHA